MQTQKDHELIEKLRKELKEMGARYRERRRLYQRKYYREVLGPRLKRQRAELAK